MADADPKWGAPLVIALLLGTLGPAIIISTWCFAAIAIKRLHDRDRSGWWWMVVFFIVPPLLDKVWDRLDSPTAAFLVSLLGAVLSAWAFVEIFCLRGTRGPNRFGSDPWPEAISASMPPRPHRRNGWNFSDPGAGRPRGPC